MRYAVYDLETAELLTVIKLDTMQAEAALQSGALAVAIMPPLNWGGSLTRSLDAPVRPYHITLFAQKIWAGSAAYGSGASTIVFFADIGEHALLMKAEVLPGQQKLMRQAFEEGIAEGIERAFAALR